MRASSWRSPVSARETFPGTGKGIPMSKMNKARPRLGRGLSSLLSLSVPEEISSSAQDGASMARERTLGDAAVTGASDVPAAPLLGSTVIDLPIDAIATNPHQPRRDFNETSIRELAASLK